MYLKLKVRNKNGPPHSLFYFLHCIAIICSFFAPIAVCLPRLRAIMAECLFNTAVPVTIHSTSFGTPPTFTPTPPVAFPFYSTAAPINFYDASASGRRISSVLFEINLVSIVANKKVPERESANGSKHLVRVFLCFPVIAIENFRCQ